jgi:hypothetical protein
MKRAADDSCPAKKTPLPELRRCWRADAIRQLGTELVDGLRGRRAEAGLEVRIVTAAIRGHCVDVTRRGHPGAGRARPTTPSTPPPGTRPRRARTPHWGRRTALWS